MNGVRAARLEPALPGKQAVAEGRSIALPEVGLCGIGIHAISEAECVDYILDERD